MSTLTCPTCGQENSEGQRFCGNCGASLEVACPNCGTTNSISFKFCGNCGAKLQGPPAPVGQEERRWATVVFADLSGFTELSGKIDHEEARELVDRCMEKLGGIVEKYGGWVNRVIGDALLAVFGAPVAHEDDPERAVRAALEMQECARENAADFGNLTLRVGVNTGETMFAPVGPEGAREPTVTGDVVNTASRLQGAAPRKGIFVGEETYLATRRAIDYQEVEAVAAKGKEQPVKAWRARRTQAPPAERPVSQVSIVGRDRELALLGQVWERTVTEKRPHLVTILGPPGIGKTRLASEFVASVEGADAVRGRSLPYGESTGYGAFAQQVEQLAGIFESDSAPVASLKLEKFLEELLGPEEAGELAAPMSIVLGLGEENVADGQVLLYAARRVVEEQARRRPTVFLLEDIHWADSGVLDLLQSVAARSREAPVLFLTLARPELLDVRPNWGGGLPAYTAIPLEPLNEEDARELAMKLIEGADEEIAEKLGARAEGNPLYIEELAASVAERPEESLGTLPTHMKGIIAARIDSLPMPARSLLLDAAVVGKVFWKGALNRIGVGRQLDEALDLLELRDFIRREPISSIQGDTEFAFKHILIQEVAYATVSKAVRRRGHAAVAEFIEEAAGDRHAESASLLAHHWRQAGEVARALDYLLMASERARRAWAKEEAVRLLDEALDLIGETDAPRRRELKLRRALVLTDASDYSAAKTELEALMPDLEGRDLMEAILAHSKACYWLGLVDPTVQGAERLRELSAEPGGEEFRGPALMLQQLLHGIQGNVPAAVETAERALHVWPEGRDVDKSGLLGLLSGAQVWMARYAEGEKTGRLALSLGMEIQNVESALTGAQQTALALTGLGRHEEALALVQEMLDEWAELEVVPRFTGRGLSIMAGTLREMFLIDESRRRNQEAIEAAERAAFQNTKAQAAVDLLFAELAVGDFGKVETGLKGAEEEAAKLKGWHEFLVRTRLGELRSRLALEVQGAESAAQLAGASVDDALKFSRKKYEIGSRLVMGSALSQMNRAEKASEELRTALKDAEKIGHPPTLWRAAATLAAHLYTIGDDEGAESSYRRAAEVVGGFAEGLTDEHRKVFLAASEVSGILEAAPG